MKFFRVIVIVACLLPAHLTAADIEVLGLFKGAALLKRDGEQKLLKVGQVWGDLTLIEANSREALADVDGRRIRLTVSKRVSGNYTVPESRQVLIRKNDHRQYITTAEINGHRTPVLVDTGANIVAMNSNTARAMGVSYQAGAPGRVATASGVVDAWTVTLDSVDVGGIRIKHVRASVLEGAFPEVVLLGMSFLQHVELQERDGILSLTSKY